MAELPGRPAGAWPSPVGSWVSVNPPPRCGMPTRISPVFRHSCSRDKPGDVGCFHRPCLVCLIMLTWLRVHWKEVCWVVMDAHVLSFIFDMRGRPLPLEKWLYVGWMRRI